VKVLGSLEVSVLRKIPFTWVLCFFIPFLSLSNLFAAAPEPLPERLRAWLDEVGPLITPRERDAFLALAADTDRDAFIRRFWEVRDPFPQTPRNEARERWEARLPEARRRWGGTRDDRARIFMLNGEPDSIVLGTCGGTALELWTYEPRFQIPYRIVLTFLTGPSGGTSKLWLPGEGPDLVAVARARKCDGDPALAEAFTWLREAGTAGCDIVARRAWNAPRPREWVSDFHPRTIVVADSPGSGAVLPAHLDVEFPGRSGDGLVRVMVKPDGAVSMTGAPRDVILSGRVLRGAETIDAFRYRFDGLQSVTASWPLVFERRLQPGRYRLEVKMEAPASSSVFAGERELVVLSKLPDPAVPSLAGSPAAAGTEVRRIFAEADAELSAPRPGLRIDAPSGQLLTGIQRFEARVDGAPGLPEEAQITRVAFALDGKPLLTRNYPPYTVQIDLGKVPRTHKLTAQGLDRGGKALASDEVVVNAGSQRFAVHLVEPLPGRSYRQSLHARIVVDAPEKRNIDRVELYLGEQRVATLYQPPFVHPLVLPNSGAMSYLRAVAYLSDGTSAEDVVLLNSPVPSEKMDIRLVELYANAGDRAGRPFEGLGVGDFQVFEDGVRQSLRQVERSDDMPLRLVTLVDSSASMQPRLKNVSDTALAFLRQTLHPKDQAAVITFNQAPRVVVGLTADLAALAAGFDGLMADGETALWDSVVFSLHYLGGASGQRAVIVLSDGEDRTSRFHFDDVLVSARRAGMAIFVLGIDLPRGEAREHLSRLAKETGGQSFFVKSLSDLPGIYTAIEKDLRSRYRLTYQSSNTSPGEAFRAVQVRVDKPGVEARTISGYYP